MVRIKGVPTAVTSVRVPIYLLDKAKKANINKSKLFTEALIKRLSVDAEKEYLRIQIDEKYKEIEELSNRVDSLEYVEDKINSKWEEAVRVLKEAYIRGADVYEGVSYWSRELNVSEEQVKTLINEDVI